MVLVVNLDGFWLVDVGNGKSARSPVRLDGSNEIRAEDFCYRVSPGENASVLLEKPDGGEWRRRFIFDLNPLTRSDFAEACNWTQTSPDSIFTQNRICTIARANGRALLLNDELTLSDDSGTSKLRISRVGYTACLKEHFGLEIEGSLIPS
jgi:N-hydroxyarylamine O-acetyltransferase